MNEKKNRVEIKKIPLDGFIDMLLELYHNGIDYVNMVVEKGDHQDSIWIVDEEDSEDKEKEESKIDFETLI